MGNVNATSISIITHLIIIILCTPQLLESVIPTPGCIGDPFNCPHMPTLLTNFNTTCVYFDT
eukprot:1658957-Karenia_brevis.AAC.1